MTRRVLVLGSSADLYGAPRVLLAAVEALRAGGWSVVVALPAGGPLVGELVDVGAVVKVLPDFALRRRYLRPSRLPRLLWSQLALLRWVIQLRRKGPIDLVYSNTLSIIAGPVAAKLLRARHLWHVHEILESPNWLAALLAKLASLGSTVIVCPSAAVAAHLSSIAPRSQRKLVVLPNCIDAVNLGGLDPPSRGETFRVGCIARLHPWKGQSVAIAAVAAAQQAGVPVSLSLFGDAFEGNEHIERQLRQQVSDLGLNSVVQFMGHVSDRAVIYGAIDAVIVPSTTPEPFSLVCLEAQASARPVIAPDAGGPREIVLHGATGLLVESGSATAFSEAIVLLWRNPGLATAMGLRGRARVLQKYSPAVFGDGLMEILDRIRLGTK